jgi:hypothetical protein
MQLAIRRATFPADYAGIASVLTAECLEWPTNTAVFALNAKLGFQRQGATIRFVKRDP